LNQARQFLKFTDVLIDVFIFSCIGPFPVIIDSIICDVVFCLQQQSAGTVQRRSSRSTLRTSKPSWPDSDSDTEDFLHVVSESRKAFVFTESTLEQFHQDHMEGTVVHDPAEYVCITYCQPLFVILPTQNYLNGC